MKIIPLSLYIALRFFQNSKKNKMISLISFFSIAGTSLGLTILIICLSAINGFNKELNERILSIIPHGKIEIINSTFHNWKMILNKIKKIPGIIQAIPYITFSGLIEKKNNFHPIYIHGIKKLCDIHPNITTYLSSINTTTSFVPNKKYILLGKGAADILKIKKNDWINILMHNSTLKNTFLPYKKLHVKVIDIVDLKSYLDHNLAIIPLLDAQYYLNKPEDISGINIKAHNIFNTPKILNKIKKIINNNIILYSWIDIYKYIYQDLQLIRSIIYLTTTSIIIISCFGITSILTLTIKEKKHEIAILYTLGSKNYLIHTIFIWYGFLNSLISIIIGGTIGILISINLTDIYNILENIWKSKMLYNDSYFINFLPSELQAKDIIYIFSLELFITFLAILYPILNIKNTNPAKILK